MADCCVTCRVRDTELADMQILCGPSSGDLLVQVMEPTCLHVTGTGIFHTLSLFKVELVLAEELFRESFLGVREVNRKKSRMHRTCS